MKIYIACFLAAFLCTVARASTYPVLREPNPFTGSRLYVPNGDAKQTTILFLHGSEGGSEPYLDVEANILATQGYATFLLCYFDCDRDLTGPRQTLKNVEATLVQDVIAWLRSRSRSDGKVVLYGFSRGGELAMITGSLSATAKNGPDAIIAHTPSDVFNGPVSWSWSEPACWLCTKGIGLCPPESPKSDYTWNLSCGADDPTKMDFSQSAWQIKGEAVPVNTRIEIENFAGPILLTVGEKDELWPADQTRRLEATLRAHGKPVEAHYFPDGTHILKSSDEIRRRELTLEFIRRVL